MEMGVALCRKKWWGCQVSRSYDILYPPNRGKKIWFGLHMRLHIREIWKQKMSSMCTNFISITKSNQSLCSHNISPLRLNPHVIVIGVSNSERLTNWDPNTEISPYGYSKSSRFNIMRQLYVKKSSTNKASAINWNRCLKVFIDYLNTMQ